VTPSDDDRDSESTTDRGRNRRVGAVQASAAMGGRAGPSGRCHGRCNHCMGGPAQFGWIPVVDVEGIDQASKQTLAETVAEVAGSQPSVSIHSRVIGGHHPAYVLIREAEGAELLVLGSRGHGGFVGALLGSVSQHCVQHAALPDGRYPKPTPLTAIPDEACGEPTPAKPGLVVRLTARASIPVRGDLPP
jgi:nucleotide-binding universal stress UspA family protein